MSCKIIKGMIRVNRYKTAVVIALLGVLTFATKLPAQTCSNTPPNVIPNVDGSWTIDMGTCALQMDFGGMVSWSNTFEVSIPLSSFTVHSVTLNYGSNFPITDDFSVRFCDGVCNLICNVNCFHGKTEGVFLPDFQNNGGTAFAQTIPVNVQGMRTFIAPDMQILVTATIGDYSQTCNGQICTFAASFLVK